MIAAEYQVAIIGAGPCGAITANFLGRLGIKTLLVDKEASVSPIPRAIGICDEGIRMFGAAGLLQQVKDQVYPIDRMYFNNAAQERVLFADTSVQVNGHQMLSTFYQPQLETDLRKALQGYPNVEFFTETELLTFEDQSDSVNLELRRGGKVFNSQCRFLLACDGASSPIRKALGIQFTGKTYRQDWIVLDAAKSPVAADHAAFTIDPERPSITLPAPGGKRRWEFVVKDGEDGEQLLQREKIDELLKPWGGLEQNQLERKAVYTFHARVAEKFRQGNVFLLGDAAHITPPFAGQGMMAGLRDSQNLCWKIAAVINRQISERYLDTYDAERIPQASQVISYAQRMGNVILPQRRWLAALRNWLIRSLELLNVHSEDKGFPMHKIPDHINGGLLRHFLVNRLFQRGVSLPQHRVCKPGGELTLLDEFIEPKFYLLGWNTDPVQSLSKHNRERWQDFGGKALTLSAGSKAVAATSGLIDRQESYRDLFRSGKRLLLIRPDKMIVVNCRKSKINQCLSDYMEQLGAHGVDQAASGEVIHAG